MISKNQVRIVVIGGSFGGLAVVRELRRYLKSDQADITLISSEDRFTFIPSLVWLSLGLRSLNKISFDLSKPLAHLGVSYLHETVLSIDTQAKAIITSSRELNYDVAVIATGHRSANEEVDGLGPFGGFSHSLMSVSEAQELATAIRTFLKEPGPIIVGAAPGASCIGPAYEIVFGIDHLLRKAKIRNLVPISYITPEPFLGHMGFGGAGKIRQFLEGEFEKRDITYLTSQAITKITEDKVYLSKNNYYASALSVVIPPLAGVEFVNNTPGLSNPKGFIPVNDYFRHKEFENIYAVGVAVALPPVAETVVPVNFPKTGHMTEQMAKIAASDIASRLTSLNPHKFELSAKCVLDMGDTGAYMSVSPVRPPRNKIPKVSDGRQWLYAKKAFEQIYLWHASRGLRLPTNLGW